MPRWHCPWQECQLDFRSPENALRHGVKCQFRQDIYMDPETHKERLQPFVTALLSGDYAKAATLHPQSCLTRIFNSQLYYDLVHDTSLPEITRARLESTGLAGDCYMIAMRVLWD